MLSAEHAPHDDSFTEHIRTAARRVLGESPAGEHIDQLCRAHSETRKRILQSRGGDLTVIAVVGATGQGKTWLVRCLVRDPAVLERLPSGDLAHDRTLGPVWVGPAPPAGYDAATERYLACSQEQMQPLGGPYLLLDTPGATDVEPRVAELARRALADASIHLLAIRRDSMRSVSTEEIARLGEGSVILPVVTVADPDEEIDADVRILMDLLRSTAGKSDVLPPVIVEDFDRVAGGEPEVSSRTARVLAERLAPYVGVDRDAGRRIAARLDAATRRFRDSVRSELASRLPALSAAVDALDAEADQLPAEIAHSLIGGPTALEVTVRGRLRLALLHRTSGLWFPYRTILGTLNLTHGAWDRLILAVSGSLPSFVGTVWTSVRNVGEAQQSASQLRADVAGRAAEMVRDRLRPSVIRFRNQLGIVRGDEQSLQRAETDEARLAGVGRLQDATQEILEAEVARRAVGRPAAQLAGAVGAALFWALLAGPILSLYSNYGAVAIRALAGESVQWSEFPEPSAAMLLTSLLLSIVPVAIYAMIVLTWGQSARRVHQCVAAVQAGLDARIQQLRTSGTLRLEFDDPLLEDARFLLSEARRR